MREARKGDMALIVGSTKNRQEKKHVGTVVSVISDPYPKPAICRIKTERVNDVILTDGDEAWAATDRLIPILDPDAEQSLERQKEKSA